MNSNMLNNEMMINIGSIEKVKSFVSIALGIDEELLIRAGKYVIDAKSIMGLFSLDLTRPALLVIETNDEARLNEIKKIFESFAI